MSTNKYEPSTSPGSPVSCDSRSFGCMSFASFDPLLMGYRLCACSSSNCSLLEHVPCVSFNCSSFLNSSSHYSRSNYHMLGKLCPLT